MFNMISNRLYDIAVAAIVGGVLLCVAPLPFLAKLDPKISTSTVQDVSERVVRIGQSVVSPDFIVLVEGQGPKHYAKYAIDDIPFEVHVPMGVPFDELVAIVGAVRDPALIARHSSDKRVVFLGWKPSFLPIRVRYAYFLLIAVFLLASGAYLLLFSRRRRGTVEEGSLGRGNRHSG